MFMCDFIDELGNKCTKKYKQKGHLKRHKTNKHEKGKIKIFKLFICDNSVCDFVNKQKCNLYYHKAKVHGIGKTFECSVCKEELSSKLSLKQHKTNKHGIGKLKCDICEKEYKYARGLKRHKANKHGKGKKFKCNICKRELNSKQSLNYHKAIIHKIGEIKTFECDFIDKSGKKCDKECNSTSNLNYHKADRHRIGKIKCNICEKECNDRSHLKRHKASEHGIGKLKCDFINESGKKCDKECNEKGDLIRHKADRHNIDVKLFICNICGYKSKQNSHIKPHKERMHDIGKYECDICFQNRNSSIPYKDNHGVHNICKKCHIKATGKSSRIEIIWSDHIDTHYGKEYLSSNDRPMSSNGGCTKYRPDKLYISDDLVEINECDEDQHRWGNYECDEKRISDIFEDINCKKLIVIRWNPDNYKPPKGKKKSIKERLEQMVEFKKEIIKNPPEEFIHVYYMFFDEDNPNLVKNFPKTMVY